jgi:hypothetical protein
VLFTTATTSQYDYRPVLDELQGSRGTKLQQVILLDNANKPLQTPNGPRFTAFQDLMRQEATRSIVASCLSLLFIG